MKSISLGFIFIVVLAMLIAFVNGKSKEMEKSSPKDTERIVLSQNLVKEIEKLPTIDISSDWEKNIFNHEVEIEKQLAIKGLGRESAFQHIVSFNRPSRVTGQAARYVILVSLAAKASIRLEGDDLYLVSKGEKWFSEDQVNTIIKIIPDSRPNSQD